MLIIEEFFANRRQTCLLRRGKLLSYSGDLPLEVGMGDFIISLLFCLVYVNMFRLL